MKNQRALIEIAPSDSLAPNEVSTWQSFFNNYEIEAQKLIE